MTIKETMAEQIAIARAADRDKCTERYAVETRQVDGLRSEGRAGKHAIVIDEPAGFGGTDLAANPAEVLLAALGASIEVTCRAYAEYLGIPIDGVSVKLTGNLDTRGFFDTDVRVRSGFDAISAEIRIDSAAPDADVARLINRIERCCPVLDTIRNGTPLRLQRAAP